MRNKDPTLLLNLIFLPHEICKTWPRRISSSPPEAARARVIRSACNPTIVSRKRTGFTRSSCLEKDVPMQSHQDFGVMSRTYGRDTRLGTMSTMLMFL